MRVLTKILIAVLFLLAAGCREKFVPTLNNPVTGYLVVEGYINSGTGATTIRLTRSTKVNDTARIVKETKATVRVESKDGGISFILPETATNTGIYSIPQLALSATNQYRVRIVTVGGKEYASDYSAMRRTVDIDSLSWAVERDGIRLFANAHDALNATKFYLYRFDETWELHSAYATATKIYYDAKGQPHHVGFRDSVRLGVVDSLLYRCWQNFSSPNILISSTEQLSKDIVSLFPVQFIPNKSEKLSVLYSINLKQYALSRDAFRFYEAMRKNTEQIGSIFDAQPSDNLGNIHSLGSTNEPAIGFVEVTEEKSKRIYISKAQLIYWGYQPDCGEQISVKNVPDSIKQFATWIPTLQDPDPAVQNLSRVLFGDISCVDCTTRGTNIKPSFWP